MIIATKHGDILNNCERRIAFAINTEGITTVNFAGMVAQRYWPELAKVGRTKIGTVLHKKVEGIEFFAICCHSLENGWFDQEGTINKCLDSIPGDEPIACTAIGTDNYDVMSGSNFDLIKAGMETSNKKIILYYDSWGSTNRSNR